MARNTITVLSDIAVDGFIISQDLPD